MFGSAEHIRIDSRCRPLISSPLYIAAFSVGKLFLALQEPGSRFAVYSSFSSAALSSSHQPPPRSGPAAEGTTVKGERRGVPETEAPRFSALSLASAKHPCHPL